MYLQMSNQRLLGLVVWFSFRVREVAGSIPAAALCFGPAKNKKRNKTKRLNERKWLPIENEFYQIFVYADVCL